MSKKCRKKSVCAVVVMVAMLCISGCGSGKIKSDKVLRVGVVTYTQDDPFINALADKLKENLKSMETELRRPGSSGWQNRMTSRLFSLTGNRSGRI